jgi:ferric-dicitrate binding protein FerR (iron transport regulator)
MQGKADKIAELILKQLRSELTAEETLFLQEWMSQSDANRQLYTTLTDEKQLAGEVYAYDLYTKTGKRQEQQGRIVAMPARGSMLSIGKWMIAASIVVLISATVYFLFVNPSSKQPSLVNNQPGNPNTTITTPGPKATLTLGDSSVIVLSDVKNGKITNRAGIDIQKTAEGELSYGSQSKTPGNAGTGWHTITTPKGGYYKVILPDGSVAVLNAASSLHFPPQFSGETRTVQLTGEAYFEITKDPQKRFIVEANGFKTEVLGTHFNVNAYPDESDQKVTLLEGSIKIVAATNAQTLVPGQQAIVSTDKPGIAIKKVDTEGIVAWTKGQFYFDNVFLPEAMRQIARWYALEKVNYAEGVLPSTNRFFGGMERNLPLSTALPWLERIGGVKIELNDNVLYIKKVE